MNSQGNTSTVGDEVGTIADDARALVAATADVAGEKVTQARQRLSEALDRAKELAGRVREKTIQGAKAADQCVHDHPYQAIGVAFGVGALVGYLLARRCSRD